MDTFAKDGVYLCLNIEAMSRSAIIHSYVGDAILSLMKKLALNSYLPAVLVVAKIYTPPNLAIEAPSVPVVVKNFADVMQTPSLLLLSSISNLNEVLCEPTRFTASSGKRELNGAILKQDHQMPHGIIDENISEKPQQKQGKHGAAKVFNNLKKNVTSFLKKLFCCSCSCSM